MKRLTHSRQRRVASENVSGSLLSYAGLLGQHADVSKSRGEAYSLCMSTIFCSSINSYHVYMNPDSGVHDYLKRVSLFYLETNHDI